MNGQRPLPVRIWGSLSTRLQPRWTAPRRMPGQPATGSSCRSWRVRGRPRRGTSGVTGVDFQEKGGYAFQGNFLRNGADNNIPVGSVVIRTYPTTKDGKPTEVFNYAVVPESGKRIRWSKDYVRSDFEGFRKDVWKATLTDDEKAEVKRVESEVSRIKRKEASGKKTPVVRMRKGKKMADTETGDKMDASPGRTRRASTTDSKARGGGKAPKVNIVMAG